jgi:hypothetical protein
VHNEYRGDTHNAARPGQCPSGERLTCLDTSVTMVISTDGGDSYQDILEPPNHMVATLPYTFNDQGVPSGLRQPSNIIRGQDGYFYVYTNISDYPVNPGDFPPQWVCAMRTDDLSDPSSWRFWDGEGFSGKFVNPYIETAGPDTPKCAPLEMENLSGSLNESVIYNTVLGRYIMIGYSHHPTATDPTWGFYYSLSDDLVNWTQRELLLQLPGENAVENSATDTFYAYPSLIDPDSPSMNFETSDENAYLYLTRFNNGVTLDRDLIRFPVELVPVTYEIPQWEFETDGDVEGWIPENHIRGFDTLAGSLSMQSSGDDPYLVSAPVEFPASNYGQVSITMKVSSGEATIGQVFFTTNDDPFWDEAKSLVFDVISDGEFHTYDLDMSTVSGWRGLVLNLRLDPVGSAGRTIEIDRIAVEP